MTIEKFEVTCSINSGSGRQTVIKECEREDIADTVSICPICSATLEFGPLSNGQAAIISHHLKVID